MLKTASLYKVNFILDENLLKLFVILVERKYTALNRPQRNIQFISDLIVFIATQNIENGTFNSLFKPLIAFVISLNLISAIRESKPESFTTSKLYKSTP